VGSSKAVGEPPLMMALCVWAAAKNALSYVSNGGYIDLKLPATGEEILRVMTALNVSGKREPAPVG
jgi:xanthine dehydrogenase large subunit